MVAVSVSISFIMSSSAGRDIKPERGYLVKLKHKMEMLSLPQVSNSYFLLRGTLASGFVTSITMLQQPLALC